MIPSVYINLEDDVAKITARLKKEKADSLILVCPKRCQLFADSINLRLLKKQVDILKKEVSILTMDERGQLYAKEAGFSLKFLSKNRPKSGFSDILVQAKPRIEPKSPESGLRQTVKNVTSFVSHLVSKKNDEENLSLQADTVFVDPEIVKSDSKPNRTFSKKENEKAKVSKPKFKVDEKPISPLNLSARHPDLPKLSKKRYGLIVSASFALSLLIILALVFIILPEANVIIYPKSEPVSRDFDVSLDAGAAEFDASGLALPAEKINETRELKLKFKSEGKKDVGNKAMGSITIYNFTKQILNLKAQTTSLAAGNKTYYLVEDAMQIQPTKYKNASTKEIDENSLNQPFDVVSAASGEDFNLPAGVRLEITNQVFGSRPQIVYAKSQTPISGGTSRFLSVVTESDITEAQNNMTKQFLKEIQSKISDQNLLLAENAYRLEILEFTTDQPAGSETPGFEARLKAKIVGLAFSTDMLKELVIRRISQTLSENRSIKTEKDFNLEYKIRSTDLNTFSGVLAVHFEGKTIMKTELFDLPSRLVGKSKEQANEVLQSMAEIEKAELTLSPSWQTNFPWFTNKIAVKFAP